MSDRKGVGNWPDRGDQFHRGGGLGGKPRVRVSFCFSSHHHHLVKRLASSSLGKRRSISSLSLSLFSRRSRESRSLVRGFSFALFRFRFIPRKFSIVTMRCCRCSRLTFTHKMYAKQDEAAPVGGQQQQHPPRGPPPGMGNARGPPPPQ